MYKEIICKYIQIKYIKKYLMLCIFTLVPISSKIFTFKGEIPTNCANITGKKYGILIVHIIGKKYSFILITFISVINVNSYMFYKLYKLITNYPFINIPPKVLQGNNISII